MQPETVPLFGSVDAAATFFNRFFGIWFLSIVLNIGLASWKNRSLLGWGLAGLFLGPLSTLYLALIGSLEKPGTPAAADPKPQSKA